MRHVIIAILAATTFPANAQLYRWTDSAGKSHFTDTLPPPTAKNVRRTAGAPSGPAGSGTAGEPFVLQHARQNFPVKLYTTPACEACDEARALLNARGVPFTEVSVSSESTIAELKEASGITSVPVLLVGRSVQKGFEQGAYHHSLDAAGYPQTGILPRRTQAEPKQIEPSATEQTQSEPAAARGPYAPRWR